MMKKQMNRPDNRANEILNKIDEIAYVGGDGYWRGKFVYDGKYIDSFLKRYEEKLPRKGIFFIKNEYIAEVKWIRVDGVNYEIPDWKIAELEKKSRELMKKKTGQE